MTPRVKDWVVAALVLAIGTVACAPTVKWLTPQGEPLTDARCDDPKPAKDGGPDICYSREIKGTPRDLAKCENDRGRVWTSMLGPYHICYFPPADIGKSCRRSTDCEVQCDATTKTCQGFDMTSSTLDENGNLDKGHFE
jgi:hypothetical protein